MKRIFIVDDDLRGRLRLRDILEARADWRITEARSGEEALARLGGLDLPDLCIVGAGVGDGTGADFVSRLREAKAGPPLRLPLLLCATAAERDTLSAALRLDAAFFLLKPYEPEAVLAAVGRALAMG